MVMGLAVPQSVTRWRRFSPRLIKMSLAVLSVLGSSASVFAASGTWNSTATTGAWQTTTNWISSNVPGATSGTTNADTATFNSTSSTTSIIPDAARNLENITFDTSAVAYTIGATGGNTLLLTATGEIQIASTFSGSNITETINAPLTLEGNYTFADNGANPGDLLTFGGAIGSGAIGAHTLTIAGFGNTTINGVIAGAGTIGLVKSDNGTLTLGASNSFIGGVTINAGALVVNNVGALNSTTPNAVAFGAGSTGTLTLSGHNVTVGGLSTNAVSGTPLVQNASATPAMLTINNSASNTYAGVLQDGTGAAPCLSKRT